MVKGKRGHRGGRNNRRSLEAFGKEIPRLHYRESNGRVLVCFKGVRGKDKLFTVVSDPRSAHDICSLFNEMRAVINDLQARCVV